MNAYREHRPSPALRSFVSCFWSRVSRGGRQIRVLPDGAIDILFDLAPASSRDGSWVVGTMTRPLLVISPPSARSDFIGVRFRPGAAHVVLGLPAHELTDRRLHLDGTCPWARGWADRLGEMGDIEDRVRILDGLLRSRVSEVSSPDLRVLTAIRSITASRGNTSVECMSHRLGLSRQQLTRLFDRHVGIGVKAFARVVRLQGLLRVFLGKGSTPARERRPDWARLAIDFGYYDQAHMGKEFKALTGLTPRQFLLARRVRD